MSWQIRGDANILNYTLFSSYLKNMGRLHAKHIANQANLFFLFLYVKNTVVSSLWGPHVYSTQCLLFFDAIAHTLMPQCDSIHFKALDIIHLFVRRLALKTYTDVHINDGIQVHPKLAICYKKMYLRCTQHQQFICVLFSAYSEQGSSILSSVCSLLLSSFCSIRWIF